MRPKSPNSRPKVHITVGGDPNILSLMEGIRSHDATSVSHAIYRAAMRVGLTLFVRSPESLARALEREHHRLPLDADDLNDRTVKELARALTISAKRAS